MLDDVVITQHINIYEALLQSLSLIRVVVSDEDIAICLILSLLSLYDMLTTMLEVQAEKLSFIKLKRALVNEAILKFREKVAANYFHYARLLVHVTCIVCNISSYR